MLWRSCAWWEEARSPIDERSTSARRGDCGWGSHRLLDCLLPSARGREGDRSRQGRDRQRGVAGGRRHAGPSGGSGRGRPLPGVGLGQPSHVPRISWRALKQECGVDIEYLRSGILRVALTEEEAEHLGGFARRRPSPGLELHWLDPGELRAIEPGLSSAARGALYSPEEHQVNADRLVQALAKAAAGHGADLRQNTQVIGTDETRHAGHRRAHLRSGHSPPVTSSSRRAPGRRGSSRASTRSDSPCSPSGDR